MSWEGVGPKMGLVIAPFLAAAIVLRVVAPEAASLPGPGALRVALAVLLLAFGVPFYLASAATFLRPFFRGELVTRGPFAWCRHPIYGSFMVFFLPATALLADAWTFFVVDAALYGAFRVFIADEDRALAVTFGAAYDRYRSRVSELLPVPPSLSRRVEVEPSARLEAILPGAPFRDTIAVRSSASPSELLRALHEVTLHEMPIARLIGAIRYVPALLHGGEAARRARAERDEPFLTMLTTRGGNVVLERGPDEIVVGLVGQLHHLGDQAPVPFRTRAELESFAEPGHEKLVMSVRALRHGDETLLVLEHRTRATDADTERRFARYWIAIQPGGALVSRALLRAVARRAERRHLASAGPARHARATGAPR